MNAARTHEPKLAALLAAEAGALSDAGQARLERHLASCEICRQAQRGMRIYESLAKDLQAATPAASIAPGDQIDRVDLALRREARVIARSHSSRRWLLPLTAAAALMLGVVGWRALSSREIGEPQVARQDLAAKAAVTAKAPAGAQLQAFITALRGHGNVVSTTRGVRELDMQSVLVEDEQLELASGAEAHLQLDDGTGLVANGGAALRLSRFRHGDIALELRAGSVTNQVQHLAPGQRYEIHALGYTVAVRGTHFRVAIENGELAVEVESGRVAISDDHAQLVGDVSAPGNFHVPAVAGAKPSQNQGALAHALPVPRILGTSVDALAAWPVVALPLLRGVTSYRVDGSTFAASGELAMRMPTGDVTLTALLSDGRERTITLQVPEGGLVLGVDLLRQLLRLKLDQPSADAGKLEASEIRGVVQAGLPVLQRCYEFSLKQRPNVSGKFSLRIIVDPQGQVSRVIPRSEAAAAVDAKSDAGPVPEELLECIRNAALRWQFAPPGGAGVTFDVPLRLSHRGG